MAMPEGDALKTLIGNHLQRNSQHQDTKVTLQYYTTEVVVPINMEQYDRYGDHLTKTAIRAINNSIEDIIHMQLFQFLEFYVHVANYKLKDAIYLYQALYALPEEVYAFDTIKKYYQRSIQPYLNPNKFIGVNVPFKLKRNYKRA